jgi:hypothetical protein
MVAMVLLQLHHRFDLFSCMGHYKALFSWPILPISAFDRFLQLVVLFKRTPVLVRMQLRVFPALQRQYHCQLPLEFGEMLLVMFTRVKQMVAVFEKWQLSVVFQPA